MSSVQQPNLASTEELQRLLVERANGFGQGQVTVPRQSRGMAANPHRNAEADERIAAAGVGAIANVRWRDLFDVGLLSNADVVTLYLLPQLNAKLIPQLLALQPGARVVSHDFPIEGVLSDRVVRDYLPRLNLYKTCFLFTAPLRLQRTAARHEWAESARLAC